MALFYFVARQKPALNWNEVHGQIMNLDLKYLRVIPIPYTLNLSYNGIGITASGQFKDSKKEVKLELTRLLTILWQNNFVVVDLYKGKEVNAGSLFKVMDYL